MKISRRVEKYKAVQVYFCPLPQPSSRTTQATLKVSEVHGNLKLTLQHPSTMGLQRSVTASRGSSGCSYRRLGLPTPCVSHFHHCPSATQVMGDGSYPACPPSVHSPSFSFPQSRPSCTCAPPLCAFSRRSADWRCQGDGKKDLDSNACSAVVVRIKYIAAMMVTSMMTSCATRDIQARSDHDQLSYLQSAEH